MFKKILLCLFLLNFILTDDTHTLVLNNEEVIIDDATITIGDNNDYVSIQNGENIEHYESGHENDERKYGEATDASEMHTTEECNRETLVKIQKKGTYIVSGSLKGQLFVDLPEDKANDNKRVVTLVLKGVNIQSEIAPGLLFKNVYEIDPTEYEDNGITITSSQISALDFSKVGAKIIIADDSTNTVKGSHVPKVYKYVTKDGVLKQKKDYKYDGAFYSKVSMSIKGETKGNGILNIYGDREGLDSDKHLLIESGNINVASKDDGVNTSEDGGSVCLIKGGTLTVNGGLGSEGDGIDSNGILIIQGGTVFTASSPKEDCGLDADLGIVINGGTVVGVGSTKYGASDECKQPTMNLKFSAPVDKKSKLIIKDSSRKEIISYSPSSAGFAEGTEIREFKGAVISHPKFKLNEVYYLYLDKTELYNANGESTSGSDLMSKEFKLTSTSTTFYIANELSDKDFGRYINFSFGSIISLLIILF